MNTRLTDLYPQKNSNPAARDDFFTVTELSDLQKYVRDRECSIQDFPPSCDINLFFGFFFDGTNNNLKRDRRGHTHSNVARLYGAFPGGKDRNESDAWPGANDKYRNFFRTYVPGAGTQFDEVGDTGKGFTLKEDRPKGLAFCYKGENRIIWALVQAINNVHWYYTNQLLIDDEKFLSDVNGLTLPSFSEVSRGSVTFNEWETHRTSNLDRLRSAFTKALATLHANLKTYVPIGPGKSRDNGVVNAINTSLNTDMQACRLAQRYMAELVL